MGPWNIGAGAPLCRESPLMDPAVLWYALNTQIAIMLVHSHDGQCM